MIYMDYAASTPVKKEVVDKLNECIKIYGNPSSQHAEGYMAKNIIDEASNIIGLKLNCDPNNLYYTSGATMSNNLIIQGFLKNENAILIYSTIEHSDIILLEKYYHNQCYPVNVDYNGFIDINELKSLLKVFENNPVLVSIQMANNEIGTIQHMKDISNIIHSYPNTWLHTDATQYITHYPINIKQLNINALSMSGQKIGCIKGVGLLYCDKSIPIKPIIYGEQGLIGGTENVLGIACLGKAFECLEQINDTCIEKRNYMVKQLVGDIVGSDSSRIPNNICMYFDGVNSDVFIEALSENGLCASAGSACSSNSDEPSHVLIAIGLQPQYAECCVRFTFDPNISYDEIDTACNIINTTYKIMKG